MFTQSQAKQLGKGLAAQVERSKDVQAMTLRFEWTGGKFSPAQMIGLIDRLIESKITTKVTSRRVWNNELENTLLALENTRGLVEQLQQQLREAQAKLDLQPAAGEQAISLKEWAESRGWSYSTAWRHKAAGRVKTINVGGGTKHDNVLVYPATFVAPVKGKRA